MRRLTLIAGLVALTACPPQSLPNPPPITQFYFPTGIVHVDGPAGNDDGFLYVASANFDKRFDNGAVMAVDLAKLGLPAFDAGTGGVPKQILDLKIAPQSTVQIGSFAGEMVAFQRPEGVRLFVPSRSEDHRLYAIDTAIPKTSTDVPLLGCLAMVSTRPPPTPSPDGGYPLDCTQTGISLVQFEKGETGIPRAPSPIGVAISPGTKDLKPEVWVTALQQADTPKGSTLDTRGYVVHFDAERPVAFLASYVNVGQGATHAIAVGQKYAYATGRIYASNVPANLVRAIDTQSHEVFATSLESSFTAFEARGVALSTDESRLYVLGRAPDTLIVASIRSPFAVTPEVRVERTLPVPEGPSLMSVIPRAGRSDLIAITSSTAGVLSFYDDEVGDLVGQIAGVGLQPYAIATDLRPGGGARLYVTNFTDGRVAVIDVPDLVRPASAKIVAFLGASQLCLTRGVNERTTCDGGTQ